MSKIFLGCLISLLVGCSKSNESAGLNITASESIIGGEKASPNSIISVSSVYIGVGFLKNGRRVHENNCTGVLISPQVVLTAAHCFFHDMLEYDSKKSYVVFGADLNDRSSLTVVFSNEVRIHDEYNDSENLNNYDVAAIILPHPAPAPFKPAKILDNFRRLQIGDMLQFGGYGLSYEIPKSFPNYLKMVELKVSGIAFDSIDVRESDSGAACGGDSGGPAFLHIDGEAYLVGTNIRGYGSNGRKCGLKNTITRLDYLRTFLDPFIQ